MVSFYSGGKEVRGLERSNDLREVDSQGEGDSDLDLPFSRVCDFPITSYHSPISRGILSRLGHGPSPGWVRQFRKARVVGKDL